MLRKFLALSLVLSLLCASLVMAQTINIPASRQATGVFLANDGARAQAVKLECHFKALLTEKVQTPAGVFTRLFIPGWHHDRRQVGAPELPVMNKTIEVPLGARLHIRVTGFKTMQVDLNQHALKHRIYPAQPPCPKSGPQPAFCYSRAAYQRAPARKPLVSVRDLGIMRSFRLALVQFAPISYDPVANTLTIHYDIEAVLEWEGANLAQTRVKKENSFSPYFEVFKRRFLAPRALQVAPRRNRLDNYLIVADPMFKGNTDLANFVAWRQSEFNVTLIYTDDAAIQSQSGGALEDKLRNYIISLYNNPATRPTFLLLVGDHPQIPGHDYGKHVSDIYYVAVDGDDFMPDILCGRFSAQNNEDLSNQIVKTMAYGQGQLPSYDYLKRYVLVAGWDGNWAVKRGYPHVRYEYKYYFKPPVFIAPDETDDAPTQNVFLSKHDHHHEQQIIDLVNAGVGFFQYTAHGYMNCFADPELTNEQVDALTNTNKYCLVLGNCCLTGKFNDASYEPCFAEKWLRVPNKGAIGFIGGSNSTYWDEDIWFGIGNCALTANIDQGNPPAIEETDDGAVDAAFKGLGQNCNASVMYTGNLAVQEAGSSRVDYYWQVYHLFGDPALRPMWASPHAVSTPQIPKGPVAAAPHSTLTYTTGGASCSQQHAVEYQFDCGNGKVSDWSSQTTFTYTFDNEGLFAVKARARCKEDPKVVSQWSAPCLVGISTDSVSTPNAPNGPSAYKTGYAAKFTVDGASCDHGHAVEYRFDWGDGHISDWTSKAAAEHVYEAVGTFTVKAQARCQVKPYTISAWSSGSTIAIESSIESQEYVKDESLNIPDNDPNGVSSTLAVDCTKTIVKVDVYVNIVHTYIGDLMVKLVSPQGTEYVLHNRTGGSADNIDKTYEGLTAFTNENAQGTWQLVVSDHASSDEGVLRQWKVKVYYQGPPPAQQD